MSSPTPDEPATPPGHVLPDDTPSAPDLAGRRVQGLADGFGQTWFKRFTVALPRQSDAPAVMREWRQNIDSFWPETSHFYAPEDDLEPGTVAGIEFEGPAGSSVSTGVAVDRVSPRSVLLRTPQGHVFAGWIRLQVQEVAGGGSEASAVMQIRPSDPLFQIAFWLGGDRQEDRFWEHTVSSLAEHFGEVPAVRIERRPVSKALTWRNAPNIYYNAAVRTTLRNVSGGIARLLKRRTHDA